MFVRKNCFRPGPDRALSWLCSLVAVLASWLSPLTAQEASPAGASTPLSSIAEINRTLTDPARTVAAQIRFRGTVIFTSRAGDFCLQQDESGLMIEPPDPALRPALGDLVEVEAAVAFLAADTLDPGFFFKPTTARILGRGILPEPVRTSLPAALNGGTAGRWVEIEGVVMQSALQNGVVTLHLSDASGWAVVNVHDWRAGLSLREGWGARLRVRCANVGRGHAALRVSSSDQITVIAPGTEELFAAPLADPAALRAGGARADRLRLTGTVLAQQGEYIYLRSGQGPALRASVLQPFHAGEGTHPLELIPPPLPKALTPGDRVELVGSPLVVAPFIQLSFAAFRRLSTGELPPAISATDRDPAALACDHVTLNGRLLWHEPATAAGALEKLAMDCRSTTIHAEVLPAADSAASPGTSPTRFQADDLIEATGVLFPAEHGRPFMLRIAQRPGLRLLESISPARPVLSPVAWRWIIGLTAGLAVALGGAWWLQRQVRQRTAALAISNATLRDEVAVREKAETDLACALAQERDLGELKSRFVSTVSHEFRTPLGITMSAVELLRHYEDRLPPEEKTQLYDDIHTATKNMAGLMEQVLVLGRVDAGKLPYKPAPLDIDALALKLTDESLSATNRKCPIAWSAVNDLSGAHADEALLRHIFTNLLSNGVKYSPVGATVYFRACREGLMAVFTVQDGGIGIPEAEIPELFEAFHRASNVDDIPGTGLGLVISKRCAELHGGSIQVKSAPGEGTTFTVGIPAW